MIRHRLMVVDHHVSRDSTSSFEAMAIDVHGMMAQYHWARLDDTHVLVSGHYHMRHHDTLHNHVSVSVLPHQISGKSLKEKVKHERHYKALQTRLGVADDHTLSDLIDAAEYHFGSQFSPEK